MMRRWTVECRDRSVEADKPQTDLGIDSDATEQVFRQGAGMRPIVGRCQCAARVCARISYGSCSHACARP